MSCGFCAVEVDFKMRSITKRLGVRVATAAESVGILLRIGDSIFPLAGIPSAIVEYDFFKKRDIA
jgi:hypothetical protein